MNAAENAETDLKHYKINIDGTERNVYDLIFYKERWEKTTKKSDVAKINILLKNVILYRSAFVRKLITNIFVRKKLIVLLNLLKIQAS